MTAEPPTEPPPDLVGQPVEEAARRCRDAGWAVVRTLEPDTVITLEHRPGRINLTAVDGVVVQVHAG